MSVILGIDLGTSSVKAMLLDSDEGVLATENCNYEVEIPQEGFAEQNPNEWWENTKKVLIKLRNVFPEYYEKISAIGFSGQMHGLVVVNSEGIPVRNAILWLDQRSKKELKEINDRISCETMGETFGTRVFTGFAFASLLWLKNNEPDELKRIATVMMPKDFIRYKITGKLGTEASDASSTAIFNIKNRDWDYDIIKEFGFDKAIFPKCGEATDIAGYVTAQCASECGLREGIPVVFGAGDQQAQSIGNGIHREGDIICNIGTGGQISTYINEPKFDKKLRTHTFCHAINKGYTIYGATLCSGMSLNWLKNKVLYVDSYNELSRFAEEVVPGCEGLVYLPYLSGERTPHMNPGAKGMFYGLTLGMDRRYFSRAVMEGVTYSLKDSLEIFEELGIKCKTIIASGGGANSDVWLQIQADIFNKEVKVSEVNEQACLGACIVAGIGSGIFKTIEEPTKRFIKFKERVYKPKNENVIVYQKQYEVYKKLYINNLNLF